MAFNGAFAFGGDRVRRDYDRKEKKRMEEKEENEEEKRKQRCERTAEERIDGWNACHKKRH
jgi:hypothetical protein